MTDRLQGLVRVLQFDRAGGRDGDGVGSSTNVARGRRRWTSLSGDHLSVLLVPWAQTDVTNNSQLMSRELAETSLKACHCAEAMKLCSSRR